MIERALMGMRIAVDAPDAPAERAFAWLERVDALFSTYRADSEIARLERHDLALRDADPSVREVLARAEELRRRTRGYFDVRATGRLDPSGLVKGWAVDRAGALLDGAGVRRWAIDAGGDVLVRGGPWRVGIRHPLEHDAMCAVLEAGDLAVATSGAYERGHHVRDPHTGRPPAGVLSVTVVGPELGVADALATAAFAMGERGAEWAASLAPYDAMTVLASGEVLATEGLLLRCPGGSLAASITA